MCFNLVVKSWTKFLFFLLVLGRLWVENTGKIEFAQIYGGKVRVKILWIFRYYLQDSEKLGLLDHVLLVSGYG